MSLGLIAVNLHMSTITLSVLCIEDTTIVLNLRTKGPNFGFLSRMQTAKQKVVWESKPVHTNGSLIQSDRQVQKNLWKISVRSAWNNHKTGVAYVTWSWTTHDYDYAPYCSPPQRRRGQGPAYLSKTSARSSQEQPLPSQMKPIHKRKHCFQQYLKHHGVEFSTASVKQALTIREPRSERGAEGGRSS